MPRIRVRHTGQRRIRIHNDLATAARYLKKTTEDKIANKDEVGILYQNMAFMVLMAFTFEAYLNYFGHEKVQGWKNATVSMQKLPRCLARSALHTTRPKRLAGMG